MSLESILMDRNDEYRRLVSLKHTHTHTHTGARVHACPQATSELRPLTREGEC